MPHEPAPSLGELIPLVLIPLGAGVMQFLRGLQHQDTPDCSRPSVIYVYGRRIRVLRLLLRAVVTIGGSFGAGLTGGLLVHGAGYSPALAWAAAGLAGVWGWDFFLLARAALRERIPTGGKDDD